MDGPDTELFSKLPDNWGRWGTDDELGTLNYLTNDQVVRGINAVESGDVFTLGTRITDPGGDPVATGVSTPEHEMLLQYDDSEPDSSPSETGGRLEYSADSLFTPVHGTTTHVDALGHVSYDTELYNGFNAATSQEGLDHCGIAPASEHGIVGRGVLLDVARYREVEALECGARISLSELKACADAQSVQIETNDIILIRTGLMDLFYRHGPENFYETYLVSDDDGAFENEPGPTLDRDFVDWVHERQIPIIGIDTIHGEQTVSSTTGTKTPLHPALLRNLGVYLSELHLLGNLASHCADEGRWSFCYMASPLKLVGGTGSPINPLAIM